MANREELKTMIKCFRVHELQMLLSFAGRSKCGKKQELQDRALMLLKLQSEPLSFKIRQLYNLMQNCYGGNSLPFPCTEVCASPSTGDKIFNNVEAFDKDDDSIAIVEDIECQVKSSHKARNQTCSDKLTTNPLCYSNHPDVQFKKLPFHHVLYELLKPTCLVPKDSRIQQRNSFSIYLTPKQAAKICIAKDLNQECLIQLRFCLVEKTRKQEDCFPAGLYVWVNNKCCYMQELSGKKKKDVYMKETALPINITSYIKVNAVESNKIEVQWNTEYGLAYALGVFMVQKKTSEDLLNRLRAKSVSSADYTIKMIKDKLNKEADSEIVTTSLRVSLICPLGKIRLKSPCRASLCQHLQCFDAFLFLQMNEKKPVWVCPICDNPAEYDKLVIDGYFLEILSSDKLPIDVNEIELHDDGSWSTLLIKTEQNCALDDCSLVKVEAEEEIIDIVVDDDNYRYPSISENLMAESCCNSSSSISDRNFKSNTNIEKRKVDEIDLTISDSDDEPLIWYKRRGATNNNNSAGKETVNSTVSSNRSSPSIINLEDSDSDYLDFLGLI